MAKKNLKRRENFSESENTPSETPADDRKTLEAEYAKTEKGFVVFYIITAILIVGSGIGAGYFRNGKNPAIFLMFVSMFLILVFMLISWLTWYYTTKNRRIENRTKANCSKLIKDVEGRDDDISVYVRKTCDSVLQNNANATLTEFFLSKNSNDIGAYFVGMMSGLVFGLIDNGGLFAGMDALDPIFEPFAMSSAGFITTEKEVDGKKVKVYSEGKDKDGNPTGNMKLAENIKAGMGNTYSDALGSFLSVFIGKIFISLTQKDETPMIADSIGLIIGCIIGFALPAQLVSKKVEKNSESGTDTVDPKEVDVVPDTSVDQNFQSGQSGQRKYRYRLV